MKKCLIIACVAVMLLISLKTAARAVTEMEILVDKLVEKRILTPADGDKIIRETQSEAKKQQEAVIKEAKTKILPDWVQKTKLTGDFRLRYQWDDRDGSYQRNRLRFRARLALETKIA
ncbi:MAG: hypothetical protein NTV89_05670, partial [Proteobacteria bacterium]|nr:hypothetical protein [Pseudomonadota bacterium]